MTDKQKTRIPETHEDLLTSEAPTRDATMGPHDEPRIVPVRFGRDGIVFVGPEHAAGSGS